MYDHPDLLTLPQTIKLVSDELLLRHPGCPYTVQVLLWDDHTSCVEARHGDDEYLYMVRWDNGELIYRFEPLLSNQAITDEYGTSSYILYPQEERNRELKSGWEIINPHE
jgi:hypothetical protein